MGFTLTGIDAMVRKIRAAAANLPDDAKKALYQEAQIEMTESKRRVPVDTGALKASGHVDMPKHEGNTISVTLAYGGDHETDAYAVIVHEDLEAFHPIGQAKYLESVLKESAPYMKQRLIKRINLNVYR